MEFKLKDIAHINQETVKKDSFPNNFLYLDTKNLTNGKFGELAYFDSMKDKVPSRARRIVKENDILISTVRPNQRHYGFITKDQKSYIVSTGFAVITPEETKVNPYFLYKYLTLENITNYLQSIAENSTSAYPAIKPSVLSELSIILPDKTIQDYISNLLRSLDDKINLNEQIIANLEELSQTLFKRWFVDFEFPDENGNPYKSSGGVMVDSELGNIPELWSVIKTNDLFKIHSGYAFKSKWWDDSGYNVIKIKDINNKSIDINGLDKVKENYVKKASKFKVYGGEIIIALTGATAGKMGVVPKLKQTAFVNQRVGLITSNIDNVYIYHLLNSERIKRLTLEQAVGSAQANISPVKFGNIKIISADKKIIDRYCQLTKNNYEKIVELHSENNYLTQLRDTLLPKLMSGEIEIPDDIEVMEDELSI
ncbi:restriction endonuclease subunit S [Staphylococcus chromogenes]|uniref:restriction endonuclease subunit S n=1 Tax=Staphylococcus chromogenes TaxID=46126 RepID=UPI000D1B199D|nr:restriction endonuclease subunit S [Staphylococcus chromogenes]PTG71636.1 restriction endonuclease subunit S [Staphylococcus chromogenes]RIM00849.1 restriction endonuclease subunit S [Staphylococcus chromogenes]